MSLTDEVRSLNTEYRVVWRWKTDLYHDEYSVERRRVYATRRGAERLLGKLLSNGGKFMHSEGDDQYGDGFSETEWQLDYAKLEVRLVYEWAQAVDIVQAIP